MQINNLSFEMNKCLKMMNKLVLCLQNKPLTFRDMQQGTLQRYERTEILSEVSQIYVITLLRNQGPFSIFWLRSLQIGLNQQVNTYYPREQLTECDVVDGISITSIYWGYETRYVPLLFKFEFLITFGEISIRLHNCICKFDIPSILIPTSSILYAPGFLSSPLEKLIDIHSAN